MDAANTKVVFLSNRAIVKFAAIVVFRSPPTYEYLHR